MPRMLLALVEPVADAAPATGGSWGWVGTALQLLWVLFLFALVLFLAYFTTRVVGRRFGGGGNGRYLRIIDNVPLGQNRAMSLVQVSGEVYCVGVAEHGVTLLGKLSREALVELDAQSDTPPAVTNPLSGVLAGFGGAAQGAFGRIADRFSRQADDADARPADPQSPPNQREPGEGEFAERIREQIERLRKIGEQDKP